MTSARTKREEGSAEITAGSYFVVTGAHFSAWVSTEMARHIEACLDATPRPEWIAFVDLSGARIRLRSGQIQSICQSTVEQRQVYRDLWRALQQEKQADRRPDEY